MIEMVYVLIWNWLAKSDNAYIEGVAKCLVSNLIMPIFGIVNVEFERFERLTNIRG